MGCVRPRFGGAFSLGEYLNHIEGVRHVAREHSPQTTTAAIRLHAMLSMAASRATSSLQQRDDQAIIPERSVAFQD